MKYQVKFLPKVRKSLRKIPNRHRTKIELALIKLASDPFVGGKLRGELQGAYKYKGWPYRIVYQIFKKELIVVVIEIAHRQGVYK